MHGRAGGSWWPQLGPERGSAAGCRGAIYSQGCHVSDVCSGTGRGAVGSSQAVPALLHLPVATSPCQGAGSIPYHTTGLSGTLALPPLTGLIWDWHSQPLGQSWVSHRLPERALAPHGLQLLHPTPWL